MSLIERSPAERGVLAWDEGWQEGWTPDPLITVSEWADAHRILPRKGASEFGQWRTSRTPYLREIMDCLSDHHPAQDICFMASIQVGKSEAGLNWVGYTIDHAPGPMLAVLATLDLGEKWSKQRLAAMIQESPRLRAKLRPARSRDSGNTTTVKEFDDGILLIAGANSAASLSSMPIKKLLLDEVDRYPQEVEEEGDPIDIAEGRTQNFPRRKIFKVSSPTIESLSRISKDWKISDQRHYHVPCPDCGEYQALKWDNLRWPEGQPYDARYACEHCGSLIEERHKTWMLEQGRWVATYDGWQQIDGVWQLPAGGRPVVGFHINALYSPIGLGRTWAEHAARWERVKNDPIRLKVFVNQVLGECYEDPDERLDWEEIKSRAEGYRLREIPPGCLVLTAGVDVQKDRLEIQVDGWGRGEQDWTIDWQQLFGDPTRPEVWAALDEFLNKPIVNAFGIPMRIVATAVDAGYLTDDVLNYTRARKHRGVFAVKGASQRGRQILGRPSKVDLRVNGQLVKHGAEMWLVGVDSAKHRLFARLAGDRKQAMASARLVHFPQDLPDDYYMQLTAEIYDPNKRAFVKLHNRHNEALDTKLYSTVAAMHPRVRVHVMRDADWDRLEQLLQPKQADMLSGVQTSAPNEPTKAADAGPAEQAPAPDAAATKQPEAAKPATGRPQLPRRNWVTGYRR